MTAKKLRIFWCAGFLFCRTGLHYNNISGLVWFMGNGDLWGFIITHKSEWGCMGKNNIFTIKRGKSPFGFMDDYKSPKIPISNPRSPEYVPSFQWVNRKPFLWLWWHKYRRVIFHELFVGIVCGFLILTTLETVDINQGSQLVVIDDWTYCRVRHYRRRDVIRAIMGFMTRFCEKKPPCFCKYTTLFSEIIGNFFDILSKVENSLNITEKQCIIS